MKIIDSPDNLEKLMDRIQCDRKKNILFMDQLVKQEYLALNCCYPDGLTLEMNEVSQFLTLEGEVLTLDMP